MGNAGSDEPLAGSVMLRFGAALPGNLVEEWRPTSNVESSEDSKSESDGEGMQGYTMYISFVHQSYFFCSKYYLYAVMTVVVLQVQVML